MLCPPPRAVRPRTRPAPSSPPSAGAPTERVEVRTEPVDGVETPSQLLRQGRLWLVRSAERAPGTAPLWRVEAGAGPTAAPTVLDLRQDVDGQWSLTELPVAASTKVAR